MLRRKQIQIISQYTKLSMPILFKFSIKKSSIHGMGLFAQQDIPKGAIWWTNDEEVEGVKIQDTPTYPNIVWDKNSFQEFAKSHSDEKIVQILRQTMYYQGGEVLIYLRDGSDVINHSFDGNSQFIPNQDNDYRKIHSRAIRDIKAGEELTQDYGKFTKKRSNWVEQIYKKYLPSRLQFEIDYNIKNLNTKI